MSAPKFTPQRIAKMIEANVSAMESKRITWDQFSRVNFATWDLVGTGPVIIGSPLARRYGRVLAALAKLQS